MNANALEDRHPIVPASSASRPLGWGGGSVPSRQTEQALPRELTQCLPCSLLSVNTFPTARPATLAPVIIFVHTAPSGGKGTVEERPVSNAQGNFQVPSGFI